MELSPDQCYRAVKGRDPRFDGRFFTGVKTTGIYCRPVCRARIPARQNTMFFASAAAAEQAGFRACRRCRPEASPGTPAWIGTSATVSRALRLIEDGGLDDGDVEALSERLGIGGRQLRRLFRDHLGTTPVVLAQTRRAHFARRLIDTTRLSMSEIAYTAGFGSIRRFNEVMQKSFGCPPSELRSRAVQGNGHLYLRVAVRQPFAWQALLGFVAPRAVHQVERVIEDRYERIVSVEDATGELSVEYRPDESAIWVKVSESLSEHLLTIVARVRGLFDLDAEPDAIDKHLRADSLLSRSVRRFKGLRVPGAFDGFEVGVRAILGQQVTVKGASTLAARLVERYGEPFKSSIGGLERTFPPPERLSRARLEKIGLPRQRAQTIREFASRAASKELTFDTKGSLTETLETLRDVPGIGSWTANYLAMRVFREPDAFACEDLGIRKALGRKGAPASVQDAKKRGEAWRPWRAYASMHLWQTPARKE